MRASGGMGDRESPYGADRVRSGSRSDPDLTPSAIAGPESPVQADGGYKFSNCREDPRSRRDHFVNRICCHLLAQLPKADALAKALCSAAGRFRQVKERGAHGLLPGCGDHVASRGTRSFGWGRPSLASLGILAFTARRQSSSIVMASKRPII